MRYAIKALTLGGILDHGITLFRDHFFMLLKISLYVSIPFSLLHGLLVQLIAPELSISGSAGISEFSRELLLVFQILNVLFSLLAAVIVAPLTEGATVYAIASEYLGRPIQAGGALKFSFRRLPPLLLTKILAGVLILLAMFALIIPGLYLALRYWFATHVVMIEGENGSAALKRSATLMKNNYLTAIVLALILWGIGGAIALSSSMFLLIPILGLVVNVFVQTLIFMFVTAAGVAFYFSARCQHENFDLTVLAQAVPGASELDTATDGPFYDSPTGSEGVSGARRVTDLDADDFASGITEPPPLPDDAP